MKSFATVATLFVAALACAQRYDGTYQAFQRGDSVRRVLRLDRDGRAELVTEVRARRAGTGDFGGRGIPRRDNGPSAYDRYGRLATEAAWNGPVRHRGRWTERDGRIRLRLDTLDLDVRDGVTSELELTRRGDGLTLVRGDELYGREDVTFRRDGGWDGGRPPGQNGRFGRVSIDGGWQGIDELSLDKRGGVDRLTVRAGGRRFEIPGQLRGRGDEQEFYATNGRATEPLRLRFRGDRLQSVKGTAQVEGRRVEFDD